MNIRKAIILRIRIAFLLMVMIAILITVKLSAIQLSSGSKWKSIANQQYNRYRPIKATRGNIYSDNGSLLATSLPFYKVAFDPSISNSTKKRQEIFKEGADSLCLLLSKFFGDKAAWEYRNAIERGRKKNRRYLVLNSKKINYHEKKQLETWPIFRAGKINGGVIFEKVDRRFIPFGGLASRTIGFINEDNKGAGLEYSFNKYLAGKDGAAVFTKVGGNIWKPIHDQAEVKPIQGNDIITTIDVNLQDVANHYLKKGLKKHNANYGCMVLMEVATGQIKAMANLSWAGEPRGYIERYNHAVGTGVEPGSTFKLASMLALLEEKNLPLDMPIQTGNGKLKYYNTTMTDSKPEGYGKITLQEVFEKSSNVGTSKLINSYFGKSLKDQQRFVNYLKDFGLSEPLYFQINGEAKPNIKEPNSNSWSGISLPWMSIGYEVQLSPLQILTFYNTIANNGKMMRPYVVKSVIDADRVEKEFQPSVIRERICSKETLQKAHKMLEGVVLRGTAQNIQSPNYKIAGKTGTAQKIQEGKYTKKYYSSFAGYFPADHPKYSCIVVIDNPRGFEKYGGQVAAPIFREVADILYSRDMDLHKKYIDTTNGNKGIYPVVQAGNYEDLSFLCNTLNVPNKEYEVKNEWVRAKRNDAIQSIEWKKNSLKKELVPNVTGMTLKDALYILENKGLKVNFKGIGRVKEQSLIAGSKLAVGDRIELILS
ncbi:MAG: penicillin-binding protein [Cyclobacteriaceae bacterium]